MRKKIQNNIESFSTFTELKTNVYSPKDINITFNDKINSAPIIKPPTIQPQPIETLPIEPKPIYNPPVSRGGGGGSYYNERTGEVQELPDRPDFRNEK